MHKLVAIALSAGIGLTVLAGAASADRGPGMFQRADTDGDGFVTRDEFSTGRSQMFARLDANGDGVVEQAELDQAREAFHRRMHGPADAWGDMGPKVKGERHGRFLQRMDANGDGSISAEEFAAAGDRMFARLDENGDGRIAKDELPKHRRHGDGPVTKEAPAQ